MEIRTAAPDQFEEIRSFYYDLIDKIDLLEYKPGWQKGVYPSDAYLESSVRKGELFYGCREGNITAAMIVNTESNETYAQGKWPRYLEPGSYMVIHALGVMPNCTRQGMARQMVRFALDYAFGKGMRAIRLDVLKGNVSAENLYASMGFIRSDTLKMYYEDTGWVDFHLYEYALDGKDMLPAAAGKEKPCCF